MIAITKKKIGNKKPDYRDVDYVGMTNTSLQTRWTQFNSSINGKKGHSGGNSIYDELGVYSGWKKKLFVCCIPVDCEVKKKDRNPNDLIKMGWIVFMEYKALSKIKKITTKEPHFNKQ
tara:strand:- start:966 stop:1319 length:354 start_codon:yes stop_codon:yes gene_type:complete